VSVISVRRRHIRARVVPSQPESNLPLLPVLLYYFKHRAYITLLAALKSERCWQALVPLCSIGLHSRSPFFLTYILLTCCFIIPASSRHTSSKILTQARAHTHILTHTHACAHIHTHASARTYTHTHTYARKRAYTNTHTHTHMLYFFTV
jgi:hypothetical protein